MAKKPMSDAQKYRPANARGAGPGAEGRAMLRAAEKIRKATSRMSDAEKSRRNYSDDSTLYGMTDLAGRKLAEDYKRKIGGPARENPKGYAKGGMISEYGGKEKYSSKASMMKHEKAESPSMERGEEKMAKGGKLKMAMGGTCRGMGAAIKGGKYKA